MNAIVAAALVLFGASPDPADRAARCVVAGRPGHLAGVAVTPPGGGAPFALDVDGVPAAVTYAADGDAVLDVRAPLAFRGTFAPGALPLHPKGAMRAAEGRIGLSARTRLDVVRADGATVSVTLGLGGLVHVAPIGLPCAALALGDTEVARPWVAPVARARRVVPAGDRLELRARADRAASPLVVTLDRGAPLVLETVARRGGWQRVLARWTDGTRLGGWVEDGAVVRFELEYLEGLEAIGRGACGWGVSDVYHGPAVLHAGALVYDDAEGGAWAHASRTVAVVVIGREGWVELAEVPGLSDPDACRLAHAFVRSEDVTYPRGH